MSEKIADLQLPMTCVTRLIKEALPDNAQVKNEAKTAIAKSASVFVLFLTSGKFFDGNRKNFIFIYYDVFHVFQLSPISHKQKAKKQSRRITF